MKKKTFVVIVLVLAITIAALYMETIISGKKFFDNSAENTEDKVEVLNFIHWMSFPKGLLNNFTKQYPNIHIEFEQVNINLYHEFQRVRLSSGENIDLMGVLDGDYKPYIQNGYLKELTGKGFLHNYTPDSLKELENVTGQDGIYCVPYKSWVTGVWYNKMLFSKYKIPIPQDIDSFIKICEEFKNNGVTPLIMGFRDDNMSSILYNLSILNAGGEELQWSKRLASKEVSWANEKMLASSKYIDDIINKGYLDEEAINLTNQQGFFEFLRGRAAMCISGDWSVELCEQNSDKFIELGVFALPYNNIGSKQRVPGYKASYLTGIYSGSRHIEDCEKFISYISEPYVANLYSSETGTHTNVSASDNMGKYDALWQELRSKELVTPISVYLESSNNTRLNKSVKDSIVNKKSILRTFVQLQDLLK